MKEEDNDEIALTRFATSNPELEQLEMLLAEFNPFTILEIKHHEIRHSNVLSWLLDPLENHGLGDAFLRKVLIEILKTGNQLNSFRYSIIDFIQCQFSGVTVRREVKAGLRRIDILVECASPKFIMLIENKLRAKESKNQLRDYFDHISSHYRETPILPVYLTKYGDDPSDPNYWVLLHEEIRNILRNLLLMKKDEIGIKRYEFIEYYVKSLEDEVMENPKVNELARAIYGKHRRAIDLIMEYGVTTRLEDAAGLFYQKHPELEMISTRSYWTWCIPKAWKPTSRVDMDPWNSPYPIACWFVKKADDKLGIVIEVGPMKNKEQRVRLMKLLAADTELRVPKSAITIERRYTRIFSKYIDFEEWDSEEMILDKMEHLFSVDAKDSRLAIDKLIKQFDWSKS